MAGKNYNDRILASEVRTLALDRVKKLLEKGKGKLYEAVLIRLSSTLLPRLNELTGENGGPLVIELPASVISKNGINARTK
jgi:hypothetical protein